MRQAAKEFEFSDRQFEWVCQQVKQRTGIFLTESKRNLVYNRLASRVRALRLGGFDDYLALVTEVESDEIEQFVNAITTNVTSFFREKHHFDFLSDHALPEAIRRNASSRRIRVWSAGCSNGMEPYSIAMVVHEGVSDLANWDAKILATDLDTKVLEVGARGVYDTSAAETISEERLRRFVLRGRGDNDGLIRMRPELTSMVSFKHLNLMEPWPIRGPFDIIFCRNVVIYFDRDTQCTLWGRFASLLCSGGYLIVGHSESIQNIDSFRSVGRTVYQRLPGP